MPSRREQGYKLVDACPQQEHDNTVRSGSDGRRILWLWQCGRPSSKHYIREGSSIDMTAVDGHPSNAINEI